MMMMMMMMTRDGSTRRRSLGASHARGRRRATVSMSHRRKHVRAMSREDEIDVTPMQSVARVTALRGSNVVEVERASARRDDATTRDDIARSLDGRATTRTLIRVPAKFNKVTWMRAGTYVVATFARGSDLEGSMKVTGELERVLHGEQVKAMRRRGDGCWPSAFEDEENARECARARVAGEAIAGDEDAEAAARGGDERRESSEADEDDEDEDEDDELPPLVANTNRRKAFVYADSDSDSDSDSD